MCGNNDNCNKEIIVNQSMKVKSRINVKPVVRHGKPKVYCIYSDIQPNYDCSERGDAYLIESEGVKKSLEGCSFTVTQLICVEIPVKIGVDVDIDEDIIGCGMPRFGPCKSCEEIEYMDNAEESELDKGYIIQ